MKSTYIGIFWICETRKDIRIHARKLKYESAEQYGGFLVYPGSHYEEWPEVCESVPEWKDREYEDIPRGRVAFNTKEDKYLILLGNDYKTRKEVQNAILKEFSIPENKTKWNFEDEHYQKTEWAN